MRKGVSKYPTPEAKLEARHASARGYAKRKWEQIKHDPATKRMAKLIYDKRRKEQPEWYLWVAARRRAKLRGILFTIDLGDIHIPKRCSILKVKLVRNTRHAPSLDRVDCAKGYVPHNVRVISTKANVAKNNLTLAEARRIVAYMEGRL